jgi:DNA-binding CsgD family transcriptional regulator
MNEIDSTALSISLAEIAATTDHQMLETAMSRLASRYDVKSAAYLGTGLAETRQAEPYLAVTYSSDWVEHYKQRNYVDIDPVIHRGMRRLLPMDWTEFGNPQGVLKTFFGEASEFGLGCRGLTIPVHGRSGDHGLLTITSDLSERVWKKEKLEISRDFQVLAVHIHDRVLHLAGNSRNRRKLSPRELECLQWTAEGKTAWACAMILGLSEHTVRCYLESARSKLNAASNTHAVSIAHRAGLFPPDL